MNRAPELDRFLGDPFDPDARVSFAALAEFDEREELAQPAVEAVLAWGYPRHLVPERLGGELRSMEELLRLWRVLARRDLSLTVGFGATFLAALPVWMNGSDRQRARVAELVTGGRYGSFALSEAEHGSDLASNEVSATRTGDDVVLDGTKWPIGNATRGAFATVFARTGQGHRGFSVFLLDKEQHRVGWVPEPRVPTAGLRGVDLSGLRFTGCRLPADSLVGTSGRGLEDAHRTLQITRTLISGVSLGAGDTALRTALRHARERTLYGRSAYEIPVIREQLVAAWLDLIVAECVAISTARAATIAPDRLSLWSSITKFLVPELVDDVLASTRHVLGARYFLRDGVFQKMWRDHGVVGVFEGTSQVNLHVVASQLPAVLHGTEWSEDVLAAVFSRTEAPPWQHTAPGLRLTNAGVDDVVRGWRVAVEKLQASGDLLDTIRELDALWQRHVDDVDPAPHRSARGFAQARRHCLLHAAAACVHTWINNPELLGGEWLVPCLHRLLTRLTGRHHEPDAAAERFMLASLVEDRPFSLG